jgi:hypothetical protein
LQVPVDVWVQEETHIPGAKARTYLRGNSNSQGKSRFPAGMTTKEAMAKTKKQWQRQARARWNII